jgi:hypothetical protein
MKTSGYSGTPLAKKLGIKENYRILLINPPSYYFDLFADMPENVVQMKDPKIKKNLIHFFVTDRKSLKTQILKLRKQIERNGCIWVSWPKKSSKMISDVTENEIRDIALSNGLVDIKVCAVDETWSGLKLVIPVKDR